MGGKRLGFLLHFTQALFGQYTLSTVRHGARFFILWPAVGTAVCRAEFLHGCGGDIPSVTWVRHPLDGSGGASN